MADAGIMDAYERSVCQECGQARNAEAEVERLRKERNRQDEFIREFYGDAAAELIEARAEVERLREERDEACDALQQRDFQIAEYAGRLANERAEVKRMREEMQAAMNAYADAGEMRAILYLALSASGEQA